jgi:hypothetical protein
MATAADDALPAFDFTKLAAINTCPRYGIIRYTHHMAMPSGGGHRAMALEAGSAMHQCFSAIRLWQLGMVQAMPDLMRHHGVRLFGAERWDALAHCMDVESPRDCALECLSTSGFTDDDSDKRRTYSNLETSLLYYVQRWDHKRYPVWVRDVTNTMSDVGIEIPFSIVVCDAHHTPLFRYTGRVDGIHTDTSGDLIIQENKTASRLNAAWRMSFNTSHQVTGYTVAASLFTQQPCSRGMVLGIALPLPRIMSDGLVVEPVTRTQHAKRQWIEWALHTVHEHDRWVHDPLQAPMYTHSCNRYFTPCSMIPLCAGDAEEQQLIMSEMTRDEWSPLH